MNHQWPLLLLLPLVLLSCTPKDGESLTKVHVTNQKGFTETITNKERLKEFESDHAINHQPHKKVVRNFKKGSESRMIITTYHPNGQIYQLLESVGNIAYGNYKEWHPNGRLKIKAFVINGIPDIDISGQNSWAFEGACEAFDEEGKLAATFNYTNGSLEGDAYVYYPSGEVKEKKTYKHNLQDGTGQVFDEEGNALEVSQYEKGEKVGYHHKYWKKNRPAAEELFEKGTLVTAAYFDPLGNLLGQIKNGSGKRVLFKSDQTFEVHEYLDGLPKGEVLVYDKERILTNSFHIKKGLKSGKEIIYYPASKQEKLSIDWVDGKIHGTVKTWYTTGVMESQKEMSLNKKQGVSTAWYVDGNLMLVEEYDSGYLIKGKYFEKGSSVPTSTLSSGQGLVTLFDEKGIFIKKIEYYGGKPVE